MLNRQRVVCSRCENKVSSRPISVPVPFGCHRNYPLTEYYPYQQNSGVQISRLAGRLNNCYCVFRAPNYATARVIAVLNNQRTESQRITATDSSTSNVVAGKLHTKSVSLNLHRIFSCGNPWGNRSLKQHDTDMSRCFPKQEIYLHIKKVGSKLSSAMTGYIHVTRSPKDSSLCTHFIILGFDLWTFVQLYSIHAKYIYKILSRRLLSVEMTKITRNCFYRIRKNKIICYCT